MLAESIQQRISKTADCWNWTGSLDVEGYGRIYANGKYPKAHRIVYEALVGPIPEGLHIDHLCRNRRCVNPAHLEPVTCRQNIMRGVGEAALNAQKTHCKYGHLLDGDNLYFPPNQGRKRACRRCNALAHQKYRREAWLK